MAILFIKNNKWTVCSEIFAFTLNASEELLISEKLWDLKYVFSKYHSKKLLLHCDIGLEIKLELGITLYFIPIYNLSKL